MEMHEGGKKQKMWLQTRICISGSQVDGLFLQTTLPHTPHLEGLEQRCPQEKNEPPNQPSKPQPTVILTYFQPSVVLQFSQ